MGENNFAVTLLNGRLAEDAATFVGGMGDKLPQTAAAALVQQNEQLKRPLSLQEVKDIIEAQTPGKAHYLFEMGEKACKCHCPGPSEPKDREFTTNFVGRPRVYQVLRQVFNPPGPSAPRPTDPVVVKFDMAPDAKFVIIVNGADYGSGKPRVSKVIAREGADISKLDLRDFFVESTITRENVIWKPKDSPIYTEVEYEDPKFDWGDQMGMVEFGYVKGDGKDLRELGRKVTDPQNELYRQWYYAKVDGNGTPVRDPKTGQFEPDLNRPVPGRPIELVNSGDALDTRPPEIDQSKVSFKVELLDESLLKNLWVDDPIDGSKFKLSIGFDKGFLKGEPGSTGSLSFMNANVGVAIDKNDASFAGSGSKSTQVTLSGSSTSLRQILSSTVMQITQRSPAGTDRQEVKRTAADLLGIATQQCMTAAGHVFVNPLAELPIANLTAAKMSVVAVRVKGDPEKDAVDLKVRFDRGHITASNGMSVEGYKMVVGYYGEDGKWRPCDKVLDVKGTDQSEPLETTVHIPDLDAVHEKNCKLVWRIFGPNNIPATANVTFPLRNVSWDPNER